MPLFPPQHLPQGRTQDFIRGRGRFFSSYTSYIVPNRVRKSTLSKLFIILYASSVLPHSKKLKKIRLQKCKSRNLTEESLKIWCFQVLGRGGGAGPSAPRGCAPDLPHPASLFPTLRSMLMTSELMRHRMPT